MTRQIALIGALLLAGSSPVLAWGDDGHLMVNEAAARGLTELVPAWMRNKPHYLSYLGPEPDRWRNPDQPTLNRGAAPDHFIDLELAKGINPNRPPKNRHEFARRVARQRQLPDKVGYGPYRVVELCEKLEASVSSLHLIDGKDAKAKQQRAAARQAILYIAGILGHYVADLSNPHHCTMHYNGWKGENPEGFPTDRGTHARFESNFVRRIKSRLKVKVTADARSNLPYTRAIWALVVESNGLVKKLYRMDRDGAFTKGNEDSAIALKGQAFAQARMIRGATLLRDMWTTAFVRGRERAKRARLRRDLIRAFRKAELPYLTIRIDPSLRVKITGKAKSHAVGRTVRAILRRYPQITRSDVRVTVLY